MMPAKMCVIGALGMVSPAPMASGELGDVGLIAYGIQPHNYTAEEILMWFTNTLAPLLNVYPGPRSIVLIDNMPEHRRWDIFPALRDAIHSRGAILLTNPPQSPDLNPIEKFWDVSSAACVRLLVDLLIGGHGEARKFTQADLMFALQTSRMTVKSYHAMITHVVDDPRL